MDEILKIIATGTGAVSVIFGGVYAMLKVARQDDQWEKLVAAKDAELRAAKAENERLRMLLKDKDIRDAYIDSLTIHTTPAASTTPTVPEEEASDEAAV